MNAPDPTPNPDARLRQMLKSAGLKSHRLLPTRRGVSFLGRTREWTLSIGLTTEWLNVTTFVCELPKEAGLRSRLMEWAMQANQTMWLAKFGTIGTGLGLAIDYRAEHVDAQVIGNLVGLLYTIAEERYPRIFRIINGEDVLESLERTLEKDLAP